MYKQITGIIAFVRNKLARNASVKEVKLAVLRQLLEQVELTVKEKKKHEWLIFTWIDRCIQYEKSVEKGEKKSLFEDANFLPQGLETLTSEEEVTKMIAAFDEKMQARMKVMRTIKDAAVTQGKEAEYDKASDFFERYHCSVKQFLVPFPQLGLLLLAKFGLFLDDLCCS